MDRMHRGTVGTWSVQCIVVKMLRWNLETLERKAERFSDVEKCSAGGCTRDTENERLIREREDGGKSAIERWELKRRDVRVLSSSWQSVGLYISGGEGWLVEKWSSGTRWIWKRFVFSALNDAFPPSGEQCCEVLFLSFGGWRTTSHTPYDRTVLRHGLRQLELGSKLTFLVCHIVEGQEWVAGFSYRVSGGLSGQCCHWIIIGCAV